MEFINVEKEKIPYEFEINLKGETFQFEINYNVKYDYFTVNLFKNHNIVKFGEKIIFGRPLFTNLTHLEVPRLTIVPEDSTMSSLRVGYDNMNEDVFLYVLD